MSATILRQRRQTVDYDVVVEYSRGPIAAYRYDDSSTLVNSETDRVIASYPSVLELEAALPELFAELEGSRS